MKKYVKFLALWLLAVSLVMPTVALASEEIKVMVDGEYIEFDVQPQMINDRTMVPLRAIFEVMGATVEWDDATETVTAVKDDIEVVASIGSTVMYVDGYERTMDIAPMMINDRTLVPVRFVAEAFDCEVYWNEDINTVCIYAQNLSDEILLPENIINEQEE